MSYRNLFIGFISIVLLSSCNYDYYIKDEGIVYKQRQLFNQLCNVPDRSVIYKTVQVDGYLYAKVRGASCQNGWDPIFNHGYQYAECTTSDIKGYQLPADADIYHFTIEHNGHPGCGTGKQWFIKHSRESYQGNSPNYKETNRWKNYRKKNQSYLNGKCLVVQKMDKPRSRYMYLSSLSYYDEYGKLFSDEFLKKYPNFESREKKGVIGSGDSQYINRQTGKILAQNSDYDFFPKGRRYSFKTTLRCKEEKDINISNVYIPKQQ